MAPIVLFVYNRPDHTLKTLEALSNNYLADESVLYIFADGPKADITVEALEEINLTRKVLRKKQWCKEVVIIESKTNKGLADSIVDGITKVINDHGRVIVLEDDIVTSTGFLNYMNKALSQYESEEQVYHIAGHFHPVPCSLPELFFYNVNSCWGWATWKRAWDNFIWDIYTLNEKLKTSKNFTKRNFNKGQGTAFSEQLEANVTGDLHTWAIRWHASIFLHNGFCLHPGKSLVRNIGFDGSGEHCGMDKRYLYQEVTDSVAIKSIPLVESDYVIQCISEYYSSSTINKKNKKGVIAHAFHKVFETKILKWVKSCLCRI
ncbi:glycosyltransferase family 2 protein [Pontibacter liquoris]|uniref:glycosyltransferase family 2 protein n=1 Tax=Pontibacter liquoris TaxID=2905677 RepID=UPI001FA6FD3C|nr:glycosyltransferase [Pontibacter liquoris]